MSVRPSVRPSRWAVVTLRYAGGTIGWSYVARHDRAVSKEKPNRVRPCLQVLLNGQARWKYTVRASSERGMSDCHQFCRKTAKKNISCMNRVRVCFDLFSKRCQSLLFYNFVTNIIRLPSAMLLMKFIFQKCPFFPVKCLFALLLK